MSLQTIFIRLPSPLSTLHLQVPSSTSISSLPLPPTLTSESIYIHTSSSLPLSPSTLISSLRHPDAPSHPINLHVSVRTLGGKGGFGTQLRAAGGRMSAKQSTNFDSCRDLSGRRLGTLKEAQRQAEILESAPALRAAAKQAEKDRLEAIERQLGLTNNGESSSAGGKRLAEVDLEELAKKKHKFDDNAFLEESREIKENVRSAVSASLLLKKKKKAKTDAPAATGSASASASAGASVKAGAAQAKKAEKDKLAMPPPPAASANAATAA